MSNNQPNLQQPTSIQRLNQHNQVKFNKFIRNKTSYEKLRSNEVSKNPKHKVQATNFGCLM